MVFLVQDFVNLPADQIGNIWIAAHMKKSLNKKDIKKTKLSEACSQLHSDKTKKPMQLRHYGQCLIGISWIHYKQVEYLHDDCNEAFSKARLVLVRKRNVDLEPSKDRVRNITLPEQRQQNDDEDLLIDLNATNFSQLDMEMDNVSEIGSLLGSVSHADDSRQHNLAMDHEITLQENEFSTVSPNRSRDKRQSFGGISSVLMEDLGDLDIEIRFDDEEEDDQVLDESQAQRSHRDGLGSMTDDDNASVERGRGANTTLLHHENASDLGSLHQHAQGQDVQISLLDDTHSHMSLEKEKQHHLDDVSAHSGSIAMGGIPENMQIDDNLDDDNHSLHVQFDLDAQSVNGSVATAALAAPREDATPPSSPRQSAKAPNAKSPVNGTKAKKTKKKKKKKQRFAVDKKIEFSANELRVQDVETADFIHRTGRDPLHIWREYPLAKLSFDELLTQPLSKLNFRKFPENVAKHFALCNQEKPKKNAVDELSDVNALKEGDDVEQGRDDGHGMEHDLSLPMNDLSMSGALNLDESIQDHHHQALHEKENPLAMFDDDDNASTTLASVMNDAIPVPADPLYNEDMSALEMGADFGSGGEDEDVDLENRLTFDTEDQDTLTQAPINGGDAVNNESGIKPRDWSKRAKKTFLFFKNQAEEEFSFNELMNPQTTRNTVVGVFYELLVFKNSDLVDLKQKEAFGDITIQKTDNFHRHARLSQKLSQRV